MTELLWPGPQSPTAVVAGLEIIYQGGNNVDEKLAGGNT